MPIRTYKLLLIFCMLLSSFQGWAQEIEVLFTYDECGNRVRRSIQVKMIEKNWKDVEENNVFLASAKESMLESEVSVYPNPTNGKIAVLVSGGSPTPMLAMLTTISGECIEQHRFDGLEHVFDLSPHPAGVYLLKIILDKETRTWKVVKY